MVWPPERSRYERRENAKPAARTIQADGSVSKSAAAPLPWTSQEVTTPYTNAPTRTHGKVFFTLGGVDYVCSGTALLSANKSVVWTAGGGAALHRRAPVDVQLAAADERQLGQPGDDRHRL